MEFPEPTIDIEAEMLALDRELALAEAAAGVAGVATNRPGLAQVIKPLLAQAWEEGRWSPPGACMNPYGQPAAWPPVQEPGKAIIAGQPIARLRAAATAALAWVENMVPTVKRTALANQLRVALGLEPKP